VRSEFRFHFATRPSGLPRPGLVFLISRPCTSWMAQTPFRRPPRARRAAKPAPHRMAARQASEFYRRMSSTIRAAKSDGSASGRCSRCHSLWHLSRRRPGHGKAVISSYLVATARPRGAHRAVVCLRADAIVVAW